MPGVSKEDLDDVDIVDAVELAATKAAAYLSAVAIVDVVSGLVTFTPGTLLIHSDDRVEAGDTLIIAGSTAADGTFTVATIPTDTTLTVVESITDSTGGTGDFKHPAGWERVGIEPALLPGITGDTLALALQQHKNRDELTHLLAENAFEEVTRTAGLVTNVTVYTNAGKTEKIREQIIARTGGLIDSVVTKQYENGNLIETMTETITRTGGNIDSVDTVIS